jgi:hypothetical protein
MSFNEFYIEKIPPAVARRCIIKNHYTHKWSICTESLGLYDRKILEEFFCIPKLLGVASFGPTVGVNVCKSVSPILNNSNLLELKRLWIDDICGKNTESWFISRAIEYIKIQLPSIKCLVSYADPDAGHRGIIYQATNWIYQDIERPKNSSGYLFSFDQGRTWVHPRTLFNRYKTFNVDKLVEMIPRPFWTKELAIKHRYIYPLGDKVWRKKLIASFNYHHVQYPKEKRDGEIIKKYG